MNVEIFCERGVRREQGAWGIVFEAFAGRKGRLQGRKGVGACGIVFGAFARAIGVRGGVGHYFWGVCREQAAFARACGIVFGTFAGASSVRRGQEPRV